MKRAVLFSYGEALIFLKEGKRDSCLDVEIRGLYPIHAAKSICGGTNSINNIYMFASIQEICPEASKVWWVPATFTS